MSGIVKKYRKNGSIYFQASVQIGNRRPVKQAFDNLEDAENWRRAKLKELHELLESPAHDYTLKEVLTDFGTCYRVRVSPSLLAATAAFIDTALKDLTLEIFQKSNLDASDLLFMERAIQYAQKHLGVEIPDAQVEDLIMGRLKQTYSTS